MAQSLSMACKETPSILHIFSNVSVNGGQEQPF